MPLNIQALHQLLPSFSEGDAIGNEVLLMQDSLRRRGLKSEIFVEMGQGCGVLPFGQIQNLGLHATAILYHFSIHSGMPAVFAPWPVHKMVRYHNITPPEFFSPTLEAGARAACTMGRLQIPMVSIIADRVCADSAYNAAEMSPYCREKPDVLPILRDYTKLLAATDNPKIRAALQGSQRPTMLFVGRIVPNKCQHDLIMLLKMAQKHVQKGLRLVLLGGYFSGAYRQELAELAGNLGLRIAEDLGSEDNADIFVLAKLSDADMATLYRYSAAFVSMSEHEGFGVPLVEAMHFGLPILAHQAAAVPETVGGAGLLCDKNDWLDTLEKLGAIIAHADTRTELKSRMRVRAAELNLEHVDLAFQKWALQPFARHPNDVGI